MSQKRNNDPILTKRNREIPARATILVRFKQFYSIRLISVARFSRVWIIFPGFLSFLPRDLQKRDLVSHFEVFFERKRRITNPKSSENSNNNFRGFERDAWRAFYRLQLASNRLVLIPWPSPRWCQILPRFFFYQAIERTKPFSGSFEEDYPAKWKRKEKTRRIFFSGVYTRRERAKKKESIFRSGIIRRGDVARCSTANNRRSFERKIARR